jgi:hypothetical protein
MGCFRLDSLSPVRQDKGRKMEGALIGVIKALVGAFVSARFADKEQKRSEASVWTAVIDSTSETPMGMHEKPFNDEIPTSEGNQRLAGQCMLRAPCRSPLVIVVIKST